MIVLASPVLLDRTPVTEVCGAEVDSGSRPIHQLFEDSVVVDALLRMCHPAGYFPVDSLDIGRILDVLSAAQKYEVVKVEQIIRHSWSVVVKKGPLHSYFAAARCGWAKEARASVDALLRSYGCNAIHTLYVPEMETAPNGVYRRLLLYAEECSKAALSVPGFKLSLPFGLAQRTCAETSACTARYPLTLAPNNLPEWLCGPWVLARIEAALANAPFGSTLAADTEVSKEFMAAVLAEPAPCCVSPKADAPGPWFSACTAKKNFIWASAVLESYAHAVDEAVKKVTFQLQ
ncbi:hypothetical protein C8Q79DRAFT_653570 [Trametes meyenii]|nr:hypothetical protein C8Q79DRAFT_653570 [Trametes meyenii]